jgi:hypothetical protein
MRQPPSQAALPTTTPVDDLVAAAGDAERAGDLLRAIDLLTRANRVRPDAAVEYSLVALRCRSFDRLDTKPGSSTTSSSVTSPVDVRPGAIPEVALSDLSAGVLRHHITRSGCVHVRELLDGATVEALVDGIDRALEVWAGLRRPYLKPTGSPWFDPLQVDDEAVRAGLGRKWVNNSGGLLTADSPRMLAKLLETLDAAGMRELVREFLGERPTLSANKCTIRRVPVDTDSGWHQDGAFLGSGVRALNIWLALTPCGRDAPGLDVLARRLDHIVETGTRGAYFDWAVGADVVRELAGASGVVRPQFAAGDALLFDHLLLHRTAAEPTMTRPRHAIETWCFAPSAYPSGHVPIVW